MAHGCQKFACHAWSVIPLQRTSARIRAPWFRVHPGWTVAVVAALFIVVLLVRLSVGEPADATTFFYLFPICLTALAFGRWPGIGAGILSVVLTGLWVVVDGIDLTVIGWVSRVLPMVALGALIGDGSDQLKAAELLRVERETSTQRHRQAIEINESLVQGMAAARWLLEAGRPGAALEILDGALAQGQQLVSDMMRDAHVGITSYRATEPANAVARPE